MNLMIFLFLRAPIIDTVFIPAKVLINKTVHAILNPALDLFIKHLYGLEEEKIMSLTKQLLEIDLVPLIFSLKIDLTQAPMLIENDYQETLTLSLLRTSLKDRHFTNNLIPLMRIRHKEVTLLPEWNSSIEKNDLFLFAGDANAQDHLEYIAQNYYEFRYALYGTEKGLLKLKKRQTP